MGHFECISGGQFSDSYGLTNYVTFIKMKMIRRRVRIAHVYIYICLLLHANKYIHIAINSYPCMCVGGRNHGKSN